MRHILFTLTALMFFTACGEDRDPRLEKLEEKAPSVLVVYSDQEALNLMDTICDQGSVPGEGFWDPGVSLQDQGYASGLALGAC